MKFLVSLLGLGKTFGGIFMGSIQQNVLKTEKPYIDILFEEIEKNIRKFSEENPLTEKNACEIKKASSSDDDCSSRKKRNDICSGEKPEPKNTLGVWTDIWVGLLSDYISGLWKNNMTSSTTINEKSRNFSDEEREKAIQYADTQNKKEKEKFEEKLSEKKSEIEDIYKRMKDFILKIEFPENYKYNKSDSTDAPYENYVRDIK